MQTLHTDTPTLDLSGTPLLQDDSNKTILSEKKFSKECIRCCVKETRNIASLEELLGKTKENTLLNNIIYIHLFITMLTKIDSVISMVYFLFRWAGFFLTANDETRKHVNGLIKEAIISTIKLEDEQIVIELLEFLHNDKKIKTLTDTTELNDDAILHATVQQRSETLTIILKWIQNNRNKKFNHRSKSYNPNQGCGDMTFCKTYFQMQM